MEILLQAENALQLGLLDQAERRYWQVLESDTANAIAIVGLGRVALERGDERTALAFGRRALGVDPENSVARRLVDRLEEVIRERGDVVPPESPSGSLPPAPAGPPARSDPASAATSSALPPSAEPLPPPATSSSTATSASMSTEPPPSSKRKPRRGLLDRLLGRP